MKEKYVPGERTAGTCPGLGEGIRKAPWKNEALTRHLLIRCGRLLQAEGNPV